MTQETVLQIHHLKTYFNTRRGTVKAVEDVNLDLHKGECLCLVGESGCGKTATAMSVLRLIDTPPGRIVGGEILYRGTDLLTCSQIQLHLRTSSKITRERSVSLMQRVGIPNAEERLKLYPHQFSGGMKQRVLIASALSCDPEILIADEPTTALDTTIKLQILEIFQDLRSKSQMSIIFITHDLATVAEIADRIVVMYGGTIVERGTVFDIFDRPAHPYTLGLLNCLPKISFQRKRFTPIPGSISSLIDSPPGCIFYPRCDRRKPFCQEARPSETNLSEEHFVACYNYIQAP
jgi:oligopeptide/dipeptide ABC transporter ATP-binding protein